MTAGQSCHDQAPDHTGPAKQISPDAWPTHYPIICTVAHDVLLIVVVAVGHRREVYDR